MKLLFLTCALCALFLGVLSSAVPNPDALANPEALPNPVANPEPLPNPVANPEPLPEPEADPEADPEALPASLEVSGNEIVARQESTETSTETPTPIPVDSEGVDKRATPLFCWKGWNATWFRGSWIQYCCRSRCCYFYHSIASSHLKSAKATVSPRGGVRLWKSNRCTGVSKWITFSGSPVLPGPGYYSMSL